MTTLNIISLSIFSLFLVSPMACEEAKPEASEEPKALNLTAAEEKIVQQDNAFSLDLFQRAIESNVPGDNILISPISASIALAMLNNGAEGNTKSAIRQTLNFEGFTEQEINSYYKKVMA